MKKRNFLWFMALAIIIVFTSSNAYSGIVTGVIDLPRTGQTTSYLPGDDGDLQAGIAWPSPRFQDNFDGTITDNLTGLVWLRDANCASTSGYDADGRLVWDNYAEEGALTFIYKINNNQVANISNCGYTGGTFDDWRMPNIHELESLLNSGQSNMATWLGSEGFSNVQEYNYWVSTNYSSTGYKAWSIRMTDGRYMLYEGDQWGGAKDSAGGKTGLNDLLPYVWPVRGIEKGIGAIDLPKTGDTNCTYPLGTYVSPTWGWALDATCTPANWPGRIELQDGYLQRAGTSDLGVAWPSPRFTDTDGNPDTLTDELTGLMWTKSGNVFFDNNPDGEGVMNKFQNALSYISYMNNSTKYCSTTTSTTCSIDSECPGFATNGHCAIYAWNRCDDDTGCGIGTCYQKGCSANYYMTCDSHSDCPGGTNYCRSLRRCNGDTNVLCMNDGDCSGAGGTCVTTNCYDAAADCIDPGVDKDECFGVEGCTLDGGESCVSPPANFGYTDWRLPNVRELRSLIHYNYEVQPPPHLTPAGFVTIGGGQRGYWTSTSAPIDPNNNAYTVPFGNDGGAIWYYGKVTTGAGWPWGPGHQGWYFWPVRSGVPDISADFASYDFGDVSVGSTSVPQTFTISNDGNKDLDIETLSITGPDALDFNIVALSDNCSNTTVTPTNSCTVDVECSPQSAGAKTADLSIPSNDPDENPLLIGLDCTGREPDISASPGSFNCGAMNLGNTTAVPITVSNDGNENLNIGAIPDPPAGDTGEFTWDFSNCSGQTVGAGNSCIIDVECAPVTEGGPWCIDISIPSNDPDEDPLVIDVCETGVLGAAPDLIVSDLSIPKVKKNRRGHIAKIFVDYKVMNQGNGDSVPSKLGVYLSRDTVLDAGDTYIGSANIPSLAPGEETPRLLRAKRFKLRPPVSSSGTWYVLGKADDNDDNTELDENNNVTPTLITGSGR